MQAGEMPPGVGVVGQPLVTADVLLKDKDVVPSDRGHAWCWHRAWKAEPVGCKPQIPEGFSE
jgi:hypothetical protein